MQKLNELTKKEDPEGSLATRFNVLHKNFTKEM